MTQIGSIIDYLEQIAPRQYQESYDNSGLLTGQRQMDCSGVLCALDATEAVVREAIAAKCNFIVAHHPVLFKSLSTLTGATPVERILIKAIQNNIALYAIHTNLDNVRMGVNYWLAKKMGMKEESLAILDPKPRLLCKLYSTVPFAQADAVRQALFDAGGGEIGNYADCSFNTSGMGTFRALDGANPTIGTAGGPREWVEECKIEVVFPEHRMEAMIRALHAAHPYETVAYEVIRLENRHPEIGSGLVGELPGSEHESAFLQRLQQALGIRCIRHSALLARPIRTVALCGGAGSFLLKKAVAAGADALVTADIRYHEFFEADGRLLLADVGHFESEQYTVDGLASLLQAKFPTFAVLKTETVTNPVHYFC